MLDQYEKNASGLLVPKKQGIVFSGKYRGTIIREGEIIDEFECENIVVNEGLNALLNVILGSASVLYPWYLGVFSGNYTPVASVGAATIASAATEFISYSGGVRPTFVPAAAASQSITNSASPASFSFTAGAALYGAFLISSSTLNGTSGTLLSAAQFGSVKNVSSGDQLLLNYTFNAASTS